MNIKDIIMHNKKTIGLRPALLTAFILLIPLVAMQFTDEMNWTLFDFIIMGVLVFGTGFTYELVTRRSANNTYRVAVGVAAVTGFLLIWVNLAVGIIGSEDNPVNLMYFGVLAVGIIGAIFARLRPRGMVWVMMVMAIAQMSVPVIALITAKLAVTMEPPGIVGVFALNGFFAILFAISALLFCCASVPDPT